MGAFFLYGDFQIYSLDITISPNGHFSGTNNNLTDEIAITGIIVSLLLIAFAREKEEDEFIHLIRLESWQWAVLVNFVLLIIATWLFYGFAFLNVMVYNMLTVLVLFIIRFQLVVYRSKREETKTLAL